MPQRAMISGRLPRMAQMPPIPMSCRAHLRRKEDISTPTGSRTTGIFPWAAALRELTIASNRWGFNIPRFRTRARLAAVTSPLSSGQSAMTGVAPQARRKLAQSLRETGLVMQWTRGRNSRSWCTSASNMIESPSIYGSLIIILLS